MSRVRLGGRRGGWEGRGESVEGGHGGSGRVSSGSGDDRDAEDRARDVRGRLLWRDKKKKTLKTKNMVV